MSTKGYSARDLLNEIAKVDDLDAEVVVVFKGSDPIHVKDISFTSDSEEGSVLTLEANLD